MLALARRCVDCAGEALPPTGQNAREREAQAHTKAALQVRDQPDQVDDDRTFGSFGSNLNNLTGF